MDDVSSESCRLSLHQNLGEHQNLDFVQLENIPKKFIQSFKTIAVSWEVREKFAKGAVIIPEKCNVVLQKSIVQILELRRRYLNPFLRSVVPEQQTVFEL